jgi:shikimate kinase
VVLSPVNREALREHADRVVWLRADPSLLVERASRQDHRPLLEQDPAGTMLRMAADRTSLYTDVADEVIDVDQLTPDEVANRVVAP